MYFRWKVLLHLLVVPGVLQKVGTTVDMVVPGILKRVAIQPHLLVVLDLLQKVGTTYLVVVPIVLQIEDTTSNGGGRQVKVNAKKK